MAKIWLYAGLILIGIIGFSPQRALFDLGSSPFDFSSMFVRVWFPSTCLAMGESRGGPKGGAMGEAMEEARKKAREEAREELREELMVQWQDDSIFIEDNEFFQNNLAGIRIRGDRLVTISKTDLYSNGGAGIVIDEQARVQVNQSNIYENEKAGITIDGGRIIAINKSKIFKNLLGGVRMWDPDATMWGPEVMEKSVSSVKLTGNKVYMNNASGIRSMPHPGWKVDLTVIDNSIYKNSDAGLRVGNNTWLLAQGNQVYDNLRAGIFASKSSTPPKLDIYQNIVKFNRGPGVHVLNGINGRIGIRNNWIFNNQQSGIALGIWGFPSHEDIDVDIINNTIVSNGSNIEGAGIRNNSKGKVAIINNIIAYNYSTGIRTRGCRNYSYNLLFANGDVGNCCEDPFSAPYWIERMQFADCLGRGKGDLIADPFFIDADNYNFNLQEKSPAMEAGKNVYSANGTFSINKDIGATGGPYALPDFSVTRSKKW